MAKKPSSRESELTNKIIEYLESRKQCHAIKLHGTAYSRNNPDVFCVLRGVPLVIEVKRPGEPGKGYGTTAGQRYELARWNKAQAVTIVARSLSEVAVFTDEIERLNPLV